MHSIKAIRNEVMLYADQDTIKIFSYNFSYTNHRLSIQRLKRPHNWNKNSYYKTIRCTSDSKMRLSMKKMNAFNF